MPFDSEGNFSRLHNWEDDRINDIDIVTDHMDEEDDNFAAGLSECFLKNGLSKMKADFDAGNFKVRNVAKGTSALDAVNRGQLDELQSKISPSLIPTGTILPFGGSKAPSGYLLCNGDQVSRTTYAALFAVIGTTYGVGDGVTTFNLPNGKIPLGSTAPVTAIITDNKIRGTNDNGGVAGEISVTQGQNGVGDTFSRVLSGGNRINLKGLYVNNAVSGTVNLTQATAASNAIIKY